jgi:adenine phosphoribosyltransferase
MSTLSEAEVQAYLEQHRIQAVCEEAINAAVTAQAPEPFKFMADQLQKKANEKAGAADNYTQDGPVAKKIAAVIPYYKFKGIPRFYDINGFLTNPPIFQLVIDTFAKRYRNAGLDSIGGFDARGFVIGPPLALALQIPFFMLRKPGKMPNGVSSDGYNVEYGKRSGMCIPRGHPLDKDDPLNKSSVVKPGHKVLLVDDLVATGGTLSSGIELVQKMGGTVHECACVVELKMFIDPPESSGLPSRTKTWTEKGIEKTPVWGLVSEDILTLEGEVPEGCTLHPLPPGTPELELASLDPAQPACPAPISLQRQPARRALLTRDGLRLILCVSADVDDGEEH